METCTVLEYSNSCTTKLALKMPGVIYLQVVMCIHTIVSVIKAMTTVAMIALVVTLVFRQELEEHFYTLNLNHHLWGV